MTRADELWFLVEGRPETNLPELYELLGFSLKPSVEKEIRKIEKWILDGEFNKAIKEMIKEFKITASQAKDIVLAVKQDPAASTERLLALLGIQTKTRKPVPVVLRPAFSR